jgi:hypothetical protein
MNCAAISEMTGYECYPLSEDDTVALIETPFKFEDGDDIPAYVEFGQGFVRFFDDGEVYDHFAGRGLFFGDDYDIGFLSEIAGSNGLHFTDKCIIEIVAMPQDAAAAFAKYMAAMLAFVSWEKAWEARINELKMSMSTVK